MGIQNKVLVLHHKTVNMSKLAHKNSKTAPPASMRLTITIPPESKTLYTDAVEIAKKLGLSINDLCRLGLANSVRDYRKGCLQIGS